MKKEKKWATNFNSNDGFGQSVPKPEIMFAGYPPFEPDYGDEEDISKRFKIFLEHIKDLLVYSDSHPPYFPGNIYSRNIFFTIVFESEAQTDDFLAKTGLDQISLVDFKGEEFAQAFGIDMKTGLMNLPRPKKKQPAFSQMSFGSGFGSGMAFSDPRKKQKKEIPEELQKIRKSEKDLLGFMIWTSESGGNIRVCFNTEEEKANTLKALGLQLEYGGKFLWGHDVAKAYGIELEPCPYKEKCRYAGREKRLEELVISPEELRKYTKRS